MWVFHRFVCANCFRYRRGCFDLIITAGCLRQTAQTCVRISENSNLIAASHLHGAIKYLISIPSRCRKWTLRHGDSIVICVRAKTPQAAFLRNQQGKKDISLMSSPKKLTRRTRPPGFAETQMDSSRSPGVTAYRSPEPSRVLLRRPGTSRAGIDCNVEDSEIPPRTGYQLPMVDAPWQRGRPTSVSTTTNTYVSGDQHFRTSSSLRNTLRKRSLPIHASSVHIEIASLRSTTSAPNSVISPSNSTRWANPSMHPPVPPTRSQSTGANTGFPLKEKRLKRFASLFGFGRRNSFRESRSPQIVITPSEVPGPDRPEDEDPAVNIAIHNSLLDRIEDNELNDALRTSRQVATTSIPEEPEHLDEATRLAIIASLEENPDFMTSSRPETFDRRLPDNEEDLGIRSPLPQRQCPEECDEAPIRLVYPPTPELEVRDPPDSLGSDDHDIDIYGKQPDPALLRRTYITRSGEGLHETSEADNSLQKLLYPPGGPRF